MGFEIKIIFSLEMSDKVHIIKGRFKTQKVLNKRLISCCGNAEAKKHQKT